MTQKIDGVCTKTEQVLYGSIDLTGSGTVPWSAPHYTEICVDGEGKVDIYIHDGSNIINNNYDIQDERYYITDNIPSQCDLSRDLGNKCFSW